MVCMVVPVYCMYGCMALHMLSFCSQPCVCAYSNMSCTYVHAVIIELLFTVTIVIRGDHLPAEEPMTSQWD